MPHSEMSLSERLECKLQAVCREVDDSAHEKERKKKQAKQGKVFFVVLHISFAVMSIYYGLKRIRIVLRCTVFWSRPVSGYQRSSDL
jgi:hypothetical protein